MIEKLPFETKQTEYEGQILTAKTHTNPYDMQVKINELVDVVNAIQKEREAERFEIQEWIAILEAVRESVNIHEKQIDELQMKVNKMAQNLNFAQPEVKENVQKPYDEQRWVGCLCKLWTGDGLVRYGILRGVALNRKKTNYPYQALSTSFEHCEPVKPDDDIIFKGE